MQLKPKNTLCKYITSYPDDNGDLNDFYLIYTGSRVYQIENRTKQATVLTFYSRDFKRAIKTARTKLSERYSLGERKEVPYKILFHEENSYLYYITTYKKVVKMRETFTTAGTLTYVTEKLNSNDYELLKQFDLNKVYEEKILSFKKIRGVRPSKDTQITYA